MYYFNIQTNLSNTYEKAGFKKHMIEMQLE